jgi:protein arginine N-methyltransferase 1
MPHPSSASSTYYMSAADFQPPTKRSRAAVPQCSNTAADDMSPSSTLSSSHITATSASNHAEAAATATSTVSSLKPNDAIPATTTATDLFFTTSTRDAPPSTPSSNTDQDNKNSNDIDKDDNQTSKDYYFDSYAHHAIHEEMLKDEVRTKTYEMAIKQNSHLFHDKIVLDVGCGTGVLSMFAAQAGAKHCYAVDCSSILEQARKIVQCNGFADKITLIRGKVEDIELPVAKVDIIVSEWMGYFLLYESMLDTVLYARDKWLVNDGLIFPDKAVMYLSAMEDAHAKSDRIDFWDNVYGFDMSPIKEIAICEPVVDVVDPKALVTDAVPILHLDILTCTKTDFDFTAPFELVAQRNDYIHAMMVYFDCAFTQVHKPIGFSTAPFARYTHWKQTIMYLQDPLTICHGERLQGEITVKKNKKNNRDLDIRLELDFHGQHGGFTNHVTDYHLR